jgi:hypothetical protein
MTTGTSVLGIKYRDGVLIAADTIGMVFVVGFCLLRFSLTFVE